VRLRLVLAKVGIGKTVPVIKDATADDFREAEDDLMIGGAKSVSACTRRQEGQ
jgi:hypothetical protein